MVNSIQGGLVSKNKYPGNTKICTNIKFSTLYQFYTVLCTFGTLYSHTIPQGYEF